MQILLAALTFPVGLYRLFELAVSADAWKAKDMCLRHGAPVRAKCLMLKKQAAKANRRGLLSQQGSVNLPCLKGPRSTSERDDFRKIAQT
jgi:hypothetical protein